MFYQKTFAKKMKISHLGEFSGKFCPQMVGKMMKGTLLKEFGRKKHFPRKHFFSEGNFWLKRVRNVLKPTLQQEF